jgi:amino acid transporter
VYGFVFIVLFVISNHLTSILGPGVNPECLTIDWQDAWVILFWVVLGPITFCSVYAGYRDIFTKR